MSGAVHPLPVRERCLAYNLFFDVASFLDVSSDRVLIKKCSEDGEFEDVLGLDNVSDGEHFYVFVKDPPPPPVTVYMDFTGDGLILSSERDEELFDFNNPEDFSRVPEQMTLITRLMDNEDCFGYMLEQLGDQYDGEYNRYSIMDSYFELFISPYITGRVAVTIFN